MAKDVKVRGKCRVTIGDPISGYGFIGLLVKKGDPNRDLLNKGFVCISSIYVSSFTLNLSCLNFYQCAGSVPNRTSTSLEEELNSPGQESLFS